MCHCIKGSIFSVLNLGATSGGAFSSRAHRLSPRSVGSLAATTQFPQHAPRKPWLPGNPPNTALNLLINESAPMWQQMLKGSLSPFQRMNIASFAGLTRDLMPQMGKGLNQVRLFVTLHGSRHLLNTSNSREMLVSLLATVG